MKLAKQDIIDIGYDILEAYNADGFTVTIRQLYYQFIGRGHFKPVDKGDGDKFYKRVVNAMADGRLAGTIPFEWIEDRGRHVGDSDVEWSSDVDTALEDAGDRISRLVYLLRAGRWYGQRTVVYVWVEKEALAGVLDDVCERLGAGLFPCKGYPSLSALRKWVLEANAAVEAAGADSATILYLGDHDPDGLEIPLSAERRIQQIQELEDAWFDVDINRIALTLPQIRARNLPPFGAKMTSARYKKYVESTGTTDAWELDALQPPELVALVEQEVDKLFDEDVYRENWDTIRERRAEFKVRFADPQWLQEQMPD
jgi:hypothetical protein